MNICHRERGTKSHRGNRSYCDFHSKPSRLNTKVQNHFESSRKQPTTRRRRRRRARTVQELTNRWHHISFESDWRTLFLHCWYYREVCRSAVPAEGCISSTADVVCFCTSVFRPLRQLCNSGIVYVLWSSPSKFLSEKEEKTGSKHLMIVRARSSVSLGAFRIPLLTACNH